MNKLKLLFLLVFFSCYILADAGVFVKKQFFSEALNREETYFVSYPHGYDESDTTKKFPVVIFLHSASVDAQGAVDAFETALNTPITSLMLQKIFNVILIIPEGHVGPFLGSFYTNSILYGNYEDYIYRDLIGEIRSNYHTHNNREKWAIMGHSMGGYGSMKIALKHPELFVGVASLSGPLHTTHYDDILPLVLEEHGTNPPYEFTWQGDNTKLVYSMAGAFSPDTSVYPPVIYPILPDGTVNQEIIPLWNENNPITMIGKWKNSPNLAIFMYCGELDEYKLLPQNQMFSDSLTAYGIPHTFSIDPNGDHIYSLYRSFPLGLGFLEDVMDTIGTHHDAVKEIRTPKEFIYPNPIKDKIYLSTNLNNEIAEALVLSLSGSVLQHLKIREHGNIFSVQNLRQGFYLLKVTYRNGQVSKFRFIKTD